MMSFIIKRSIATGILVVGLAGPALCQVTAQLPYPHPAACADFRHHRKENTWIPKVEMQITSGTGTVSIGPGTTLTAGSTVNGYDLGKWLDGACHRSPVW
jgi:hypothetical protein